MTDPSPTAPECDGMCLTGSDVGVPSAKIAYPHPGCPLHAPGERCGCGQPERCNSYTHDPAWLAANPLAITWVQDEPRPGTPEDRAHREAEQERARLVEECRDGTGHSWWLELEHPEDGSGVDLSCERCPAGIDDLYPDGIDLIGGHLDEVTVDAGKHNSPVPLLIPVDCEVLTTRISNPIVGEDWDMEFTVAPRGPARPVQWPPNPEPMEASLGASEEL